MIHSLRAFQITTGENRHTFFEAVITSYLWALEAGEKKIRREAKSTSAGLVCEDMNGDSFQRGIQA